MEPFPISEGDEWLNQEYDLPSATFPPGTLDLSQLQHDTAHTQSVPVQYIAQPQALPLSQSQPHPQPLATRPVLQPIDFATHTPAGSRADPAPPQPQALAWGEPRHNVPSTHRPVQQSHLNHPKKTPSNLHRTLTRSAVTKPGSGVTQENNRLARFHFTIVGFRNQLQQLQQLVEGFDVRIRTVEEACEAQRKRGEEVNKYMSQFLAMLKTHEAVLQVQNTDD